MKKRYALLSLAVAVLIVMGGFSAVGTDSRSLTCLACEGGVLSTKHQMRVSQ